MPGDRSIIHPVFLAPHVRAARPQPSPIVIMIGTGGPRLELFNPCPPMLVGGFIDPASENHECRNREIEEDRK